MGLALEVVCGRVVNPGATVSALTPDTGNSFGVRSFSDPGKAYVDSMWAQGATAGDIRLRSPKMHDFVQGLRFPFVAAVSRGLLPDGLRQQIYSQDTLTFEMSGGGAETDLGAMLLYYENAGGLDARLTDWAAIQPRIVNLCSNEVTVTNPTVAGDWSAGTAINATNDNLKANTDYAILGYVSATAVGAVGIQGSDTSNLRLGGPGTTEALETRDWFKSLNEETGRPYIPVINSANKGSTLVSVAHTTAGGTTVVSLIMAQLSP